MEMTPAADQAWSGASLCFHCGEICPTSTIQAAGKMFCCHGCRTVFELLMESGLKEFYALSKTAGVKVNNSTNRDYKFLDEPPVHRKLVDFSDGKTTRVTFRVPAMHCIACVWLLENLFRLHPGIGYSRVNFPRKEVFIVFKTPEVAVSEVASLLASLGYEPQLDFADLEQKPQRAVSRRLWLQLGVAGFAFGNIMLLSISSYLGLDAFSGPTLKKLFGWISLTLAIPVMGYSAYDYWRSAWLALRKRIFTVEVPIAIGIATLAAWSTAEVFAGQGAGYFDSLTGLLFFLLCGKLFQQKTYDRLAFDRDYKSFFPLSIIREMAGSQERVSLSQLKVGDRLLIRNGELIPADARLVAGVATIDYSFVTGESEPIVKLPGDCIYAGGRQIGGAISVETQKEVSQSYLTSLWNQETFAKKKGASIDRLTNYYSRRFSMAVIAVAVSVACFWLVKNPQRVLPSFVSVLIVACPCALALAAPFTLGTAQRVMARRKVYLKNPDTVESMATANTIVFDKTGTLTAAGAGSVVFSSEPLSKEIKAAIHSLACQSNHPCAVRIAESLASQCVSLPVRSFTETPGCGMEGLVAGHEVWMGSGAWFESRGVAVPSASGTVVHIAFDGKYCGCCTFSSALRPQTDTVLRELAIDYDLSLLSGDNEKERELFSKLFGSKAGLHFNQSPLDKLAFVRNLQTPGKTVMMVGDGLNDSGALRQSDIGVAVVESIGSFSPASDVIMAAGMVPRLGDVLRFAKSSVRVVHLSLSISILYNLAGVSIAACGRLSPVICAILMPVSSVTVVAFACGATARLGRRLDSPAGKRGATP